jgi:MFS family permease
MRAIAIIIIAELFGTSLWFSANASAHGLARDWGLTSADIGLLTNAVQLGFIAGTLGFSLTGIADRFAASRIVAVCACFGAATNAAFALLATGLTDAFVYRFLTGVALAGIYPLGMKLVVSWAPQRSGEALGWLLGMLTLGTALPHAVRAAGLRGNACAGAPSCKCSASPPFAHQRWVTSATCGSSTRSGPSCPSCSYPCSPVVRTIQPSRPGHSL